MTERDPDHWQEAHSPTLPVEVVTHYNANGRQVREMGRMRKEDARLHAMLDTEQREASERIVRAAEIISGALHQFRPVWAGDGIKGAGGADVRADLQRAYFDWIDAAKREGENYSLVLAVWRDGLSLNRAARQHRLTFGRARRQMLSALDLYCYRNGMKRKAA